MLNIDELRFDERGLIPAVVVDAQSKKVLTLAYMSRESLEILTGCGQALAAVAAPRLSRGEREALRAGAVDYRCRPGLLLWLLRRLAEAVRSQALEKVLEQLPPDLALALKEENLLSPQVYLKNKRADIRNLE